MKVRTAYDISLELLGTLGAESEWVSREEAEQEIQNLQKSLKEAKKLRSFTLMNECLEDCGRKNRALESKIAGALQILNEPLVDGDYLEKFERLRLALTEGEKK